jgi:dTDP-D-glucose 4,6-dehydratase
MLIRLIDLSKYKKGDKINISGFYKSEGYSIDVFIGEKEYVKTAKNKVLCYKLKPIVPDKKKVKKIIFASSGGGVYGNTQKMPISETRHLQPSSPYGIGKATIEYFLSYICSQNQTPFVIYRISNPYGPKQIPKTGFGLIPTLFTKILSNEPPVLFDDGNAVRDFIYIDDLIEAITISFYKKNKNTIYIATNFNFCVCRNKFIFRLFLRSF